MTPNFDYAIQTRMNSLVSPRSGKMFVLAYDATLHNGAVGQLSKASALVDNTTSSGAVQGILAHAGFFRSHVEPSLSIRRFMSATASTTFDDPRNKALVATSDELVSLGADVISAHLTLGHPETSRMLSQAAQTIAGARVRGFPTMVASYLNDRTDNPADIIHAALVARDLGAAIVKVPYTGDSSSFERLVEVVSPTLVLAAGGENLGARHALDIARGVADSGAAGICFGRAIFESENPLKMVRDIALIIHEGNS